MKKITIFSILFILLLSPFNFVQASSSVLKCKTNYVNTISFNTHKIKTTIGNYQSSQGFCRAKGTDGNWYYVCAVIKHGKCSDRNTSKTYLYILDTNYKTRAIIADYCFGHANSMTYLPSESPNKGYICIPYDRKIAFIDNSIITSAINGKNSNFIKASGFSKKYITTYTNNGFKINYIAYDSSTKKVYGSTKKALFELHINKGNKTITTSKVFNLPKAIKYNNVNNAIGSNAGLAIKGNYVYFGRFYSKSSRFGKKKDIRNVIDVFNINGAYVGSIIFNKTMKKYELEGIQFKGNDSLVLYYNGTTRSKTNYLYTLKTNQIPLLK